MSADESRRSWAQAYLDRVDEPLVRYGSAEWVALPEGPAKVASVVAAAERAVYADEIADLETTAAARWLTHLHDLVEQRDWRARQENHRRSWTGLGGFQHDPVTAVELEAEWQAWAQGGEVA